jgi:hypothetical protein
MSDDTKLMIPAQAGQFGNLAPQLGGSGLPPSLQILLDDHLYNRVKMLAGVMARAEGFTPKHLIGKAEACFVVINIALDSKLNPNFVARHTYQTPGGQIGYDGALVQSILEQSGKFIGAPRFEYVGDWRKVQGKFTKQVSQKGNEFVKPNWTPQDAAGLGVIVRWQARGEDKPRVWPGENEPFLLTQCYPLNSPLWATDPKSQIAYLAIRRFATIAAPGILGAAAISESELLDASERAVDVTPQAEPRREDFRSGPPTPRTDHAADPLYEVVDLDGVIHGYPTPQDAAERFRAILQEASAYGSERLDGAWDSNDGLLPQLGNSLRSALSTEYTDLRETAVEAELRREARQQAHGIPERVEAVDPEPKPPEAPGGTMAVDGAGSSSEARTRQYAAAAPREVGPVSINTGTPGFNAGEAGGSPAPHPPSQGEARPPIPADPAERPELEREAVSTAPPPPLARDDFPTGTGDERKSQFIPVPINPMTDKPDYRAWAVALFRPKLRRQTDPTDLAYLMGDNEDAMAACRGGALSADELSGLEADIKAAWARC